MNATRLQRVSYGDFVGIPLTRMLDSTRIGLNKNCPDCLEVSSWQKNPFRYKALACKGKNRMAVSVARFLMDSDDATRHRPIAFNYGILKFKVKRRSRERVRRQIRH